MELKQPDEADDLFVALNNLEYETFRIDVADPDASRYLGALSVDFSAVRSRAERLAARLAEYRQFEQEQPDDATLMAIYNATPTGPRRMLRFARALLALVPSAGAAASEAR